MLKPALLLVVAMAAASPGRAASNCDEIMSQIEAKIRGAGVTQFFLATVSTDATVPGKIVGTCDRGSKKIVYSAGAAPAASPGEPPSAPAPQSVSPRRGNDAILTECRDGSVSVSGDCPR